MSKRIRFPRYVDIICHLCKNSLFISSNVVNSLYLEKHINVYHGVTIFTFENDTLDELGYLCKNISNINPEIKHTPILEDFRSLYMEYRDYLYRNNLYINSATKNMLTSNMTYRNYFLIDNKNINGYKLVYWVLYPIDYLNLPEYFCVGIIHDGIFFLDINKFREELKNKFYRDIYATIHIREPNIYEKYFNIEIPLICDNSLLLCRIDWLKNMISNIEKHKKDISDIDRIRLQHLLQTDFFLEIKYLFWNTKINNLYSYPLNNFLFKCKSNIIDVLK